MADTAARLTDQILPRVPVRQWVLSLPYEIRYRLAWDGKLIAAVLAVFLRVVYGWYRRQARQQGHTNPRCGSVTFVQRFGSALNVNPHFHVLVADGAYVSDEQGRSTFAPASTLTDEAVQSIVETTAGRVVRLLERRGLLEQDATDPLWEDEPLLAELTASSIQGRVATGERRGERLRRRLVDPEEGIQTGPPCFASRGFSLHAATRITGPNSAGLERLCRYVMRPPLAAGRLRVIDGDQLSFALKTPSEDHRRADGAGLDSSLPGGCGAGGPSAADRPATASSTDRTRIRRWVACFRAFDVEERHRCAWWSVRGRLSQGERGLRGARSILSSRPAGGSAGRSSAAAAMNRLDGPSIGPSIRPIRRVACRERQRRRQSQGQ